MGDPMLMETAPNPDKFVTHSETSRAVDAAYLVLRAWTALSVVHVISSQSSVGGNEEDTQC